MSLVTRKQGEKGEEGKQGEFVHGISLVRGLLSGLLSRDLFMGRSSWPNSSHDRKVTFDSACLIV